MGNRKGTGNENEIEYGQGTENEQEIHGDLENQYYNLEAGTPTDEDISRCQNSTEDLYEDIEFPESLKSQGSKLAEKKTKTSCHAIQTVATDTEKPAVKERIVVKEDTERPAAKESTEVEYGNIFAVPGEGFTKEEPEERDPKAEASQKVSWKLSSKLKWKFAQRAKERNLDQRIVTVSTDSRE